MSTHKGSLNRASNRAKSDEDIADAIARRRTNGKPTKQLEDEQAARQGLDTPRSSLESRKLVIESEGGWTGPTNRAINRTRSTDEINSMIEDRRSRGLPTQQLEDERASRSDEE